MIEMFAFLVVSVVTFTGAVGVVRSRNVFVSALWLVLSFVGVAAFYVLLGAYFLAATQVLVYVGAISVLMLFAVMLTQDIMTEQHASNSAWPWTLALAFSLGGTLMILAYNTDWTLTWPTDEPVAEDTAASYDTIEAIGRSLMTEHLLPFEVISVVLLVALIGAIVIARD